MEDNPYQSPLADSAGPPLLATVIETIKFFALGTLWSIVIVMGVLIALALIAGALLGIAVWIRGGL